jgi:protein TonB
MATHPDIIVNSYPVRIRGIFTAVIITFAGLAYAFPEWRGGISMAHRSVIEIVESFDIPPTEQFYEPPEATRPSIPVESEDEDLAEDITIDETGLEDFEWEAPPPPNNGPVIKFIPYEVAPVPIGGFAAILRNLEYPEIAREAGLEGRVVVQAFVNEEGAVTETIIVSGIAGTGMNEAAARAIKRTRFKPALQRDNPVGVWIAIPIRFALGEG